MQYGMAVRVEGDVVPGTTNDNAIANPKVQILHGSEAKGVFNKAQTAMQEAIDTLPNGPLLVDDETTQKLWPEIAAAARTLICAKKLARPIMLRFHGDADGISGAFALSEIVRCKTFQQNAAVYSVRDALRDLSMVGQENNPLVIIVDFGSNDSSIEGLGLLDAAGVDYIVVDHHPYKSTGNPRIINPLKHTENAAKYTAGYVACEIAAACGLAVAKATMFAKSACAGDKSDLLLVEEPDAQRAMVLDFLAAHASFGNNLEFYQKVMASDELFRSIARQANESIEEAAGKAIARSKRVASENETEESGLVICTFQLDGIIRKGEWPSSSKVTTRVYDKLCELDAGKAVLAIGHNDRTIIIRLNDDAAKLGLSANAIAETVKKTMPDFVEGGGGHVKAGAVRARDGFAKEVLNEIVRIAKAKANE